MKIEGLRALGRPRRTASVSFSASDILHDDADRHADKHRIDADDVWVRQVLEHVNFALQALNHLGVPDPACVDLLDGDEPPPLLADRVVQQDAGCSTLAEQAHDGVLRCEWGLEASTVMVAESGPAPIARWMGRARVSSAFRRRRPLTIVPLREWSTTRTAPSERTTRQWFTLAIRHAMRTVDSASRPTVTFCARMGRTVLVFPSTRVSVPHDVGCGLMASVSAGFSGGVAVWVNVWVCCWVNGSLVSFEGTSSAVVKPGWSSQAHFGEIASNSPRFEGSRPAK